MKCQVCGTVTPGAGPTDICQHCGHLIGAGVGVLDHLLEVLRDLAGTTKQAAIDRASRAQAIPQDLSWPTPILVGASGTAVVDLGAPASGRLWQVRRCVAGGLTVLTAAAGAFWLYRQGTPPLDLNLGNLVDNAAALPYRNFYGDHQFIVHPPEHLWAVLTGATNGQQYSVTVQVEDWDEGIFAQYVGA